MRTRARLAKQGLQELAPGLRRRATLIVRNLPQGLRATLEHDPTLVRTGASAAAAYGWDELKPRPGSTWLLDGYLPLEAFSELQEQLNRLDIDGAEGGPPHEPVLLRVVDEPWPFPPHYPLAPQPLAALDLLDYPAARSGVSVARPWRRWPRRNRSCWRAARPGPAPGQVRFWESCSN